MKTIKQAQQNQLGQTLKTREIQPFELFIISRRIFICVLLFLGIYDFQKLPYKQDV
mgnify:CR=1 FL=1